MTNHRPSFAIHWLMVFVLCLSALFSFLALNNARRFHPDEALYMSFARHAAVDGDWLLLRQPVDKTPLTFYANAFALVFFAVETDTDGVLQLDALKGESAGRMTSVFASILLVAVMMQLVRTTTNNKIAPILAGLLLALSPLRIVFAPTAFTDMPMLLLGCVALWMAVRGQSLWSGFWLSLSIAAKPQIIFYTPLLIGFIIFKAYSHKNYLDGLRQLIYFFAPILIGIGLLWGWDAMRIAHGAESFYLLGRSHYTITELTPLHDIPNRMAGWWASIQYSLGNGWLTLMGLGYASVISFRRLLKKQVNFRIGLLGLWVIGFVSVHMLLTLNLFDRNQLILLPIIIWIVSIALSNHQRLSVVLVIGMLFFSYQAAQWQFPIGGDDGSHDEIHLLADYLNDKPVATVIYDRWLDWELDYYMGQWTDKRRVYYPTPQQFVDGALSLDEIGTRYLIAPTIVDLSDWLSALEDAEFIVALDYEMQNFIVYQVIPPSSEP